MVTHELTDSGHTKRFTITRGTSGWDVKEERDSQVVRTVTYTDWHRVERAIQVFQMQESAGVESTR
jgi:hypothetical protein